MSKIPRYSPELRERAVRMVRDKVGNSFLAGIALYLGARSYNFEDRLHVMPVDRLWI
jgi:hypothetical protein